TRLRIIRGRARAFTLKFPGCILKPRWRSCMIGTRARKPKRICRSRSNLFRAQRLIRVRAATLPLRPKRCTKPRLVASSLFKGSSRNDLAYFAPVNRLVITFQYPETPRAWPPPKIHCRECIVISETPHWQRRSSDSGRSRWIQNLLVSAEEIAQVLSAQTRKVVLRNGSAC